MSGFDFAAARARLVAAVTAEAGAVDRLELERAMRTPEELAGARGRYCGQVALDATGVTDADVAALRAEGATDAQIFEYTVASAVGQAGRQLDLALAAMRGGRGS